MKLATFEIPTPAGPLRRLGAAVDGWIVDLAAAYAAYLDRTDPGCDADGLAALLLPADMTVFLGSGRLGLGAAERAIETAAKIDDARGARTRYRIPAAAKDDEIRLLAPVARPRALRDFLTFEGHMKQAFKALGRTDPISPLWYQVPAYYKGNPDTVVGPEARVQVPPYCEQFDFELELAMVVGRRGKNIARADAARYIAGYTIWNDFSARDQQVKEGPLGMGPGKAKDFDAGNAIGPYLVTADEIDPDGLRMIARVNGETWTDSSSAGRQFSFPDLIAHISQAETIHPGEVWGSGTVTGGSGLELGRWLKPGDVIELEIEGIGILRNHITR
jgi:2-keto-4-pentenoate hydratase/2-oxohepta-3-ene-1,7-dioic acid hydratase in catechol pathway